MSLDTLDLQPTFVRIAALRSLGSLLPSTAVYTKGRCWGNRQTLQMSLL